MSDPLREVDDREAFFVKVSDFKCIGKAKSLSELLDILRISPCEVVSHHVTGVKNDFADWISDVLGDSALAANLRTINYANTFETQVALINTIEKRLDELKGGV